MKTGNIKPQELLEYAKSLHGTTLETTAQHRKFLFNVDDKGFHYTPTSTMKPRIQENKYIELVIERFNKEGSWSPQDYKDITMNASYLLAVMNKYVNA